MAIKGELDSLRREIEDGADALHHQPAVLK
jgi:hypothetical protein